MAREEDGTINVDGGCFTPCIKVQSDGKKQSTMGMGEEVIGRQKREMKTK